MWLNSLESFGTFCATLFPNVSKDGVSRTADKLVAKLDFITQAPKLVQLLIEYVLYSRTKFVALRKVLLETEQLF